MLYGIREEPQRRLLAERLPGPGPLIAYGDTGTLWYMRRLAERPANVVFAIRS